MKTRSQAHQRITIHHLLQQVTKSGQLLPVKKANYLDRKCTDEVIQKQFGAVLKEDTETDAEFNAHKELDRCERGKDCCAMRILENQSDLLHEKSQLEIEITKLGHECIFYTEFYSEMNYIEYYWGAVKRYTRGNLYRA